MLEEMNQMSIDSNNERWLELITQCRFSGLSGCQWCIQKGIPVRTFYYYVQILRKKACEIPEATNPVTQRQ